jgi:hypothetical protein
MSAGSHVAPDPGRRRPRRPAGLLVVAALVVVTAVAVVAALAVGRGVGEDRPQQPRHDGTGPAGGDAAEAHLDLSALPVPRTEFCDTLGEDDVEQALGGPVADTAHYGNGDDFAVMPGQVDISHEYGCVFESGDGTTASAWVFARPVLASEASRFVRRTRRAPGCAVPESLVFASPGVTSVCRVPAPRSGGGPAVRARLEGLFGDTWLGCEVSEPLRATEASGTASPTTRAGVLQRAEQWCTEVVTAVGAS